MVGRGFLLLTSEISGGAFFAESKPALYAGELDWFVSGFVAYFWWVASYAMNAKTLITISKTIVDNISIVTVPLMLKLNVQCVYAQRALK